MTIQKEQFYTKGWCKFTVDNGIIDWINSLDDALAYALTAAENQDWIRCNGSWFVGVNALPNDPTGAIPGGLTLKGPALNFLRQELGFGNLELDRGQISICYPGYPKRSNDETKASHNYRMKRDAAHIDGLLPVGPDRRRYLDEPHAYVLGIPTQDVSLDTSPLVIWEGSHEIARKAFKKLFENVPSNEWPKIDLTDCYHQLRRDIFDRCPKITVTAKKGEAYLIHRLALHGMAPWLADNNQKNGRTIIYFRPPFDDCKHWLQAN